MEPCLSLHAKACRQVVVEAGHTAHLLPLPPASPPHPPPSFLLPGWHLHFLGYGGRGSSLPVTTHWHCHQVNTGQVPPQLGWLVSCLPLLVVTPLPRIRGREFSSSFSLPSFMPTNTCSDRAKSCLCLHGLALHHHILAHLARLTFNGHCHHTWSLPFPSFSA